MCWEFPGKPGGGLEPHDKNTGRPHGSCLDELREQRFWTKGVEGIRRTSPVLLWMNSVNGVLGQRVKGHPVFRDREPDG